MEFIANTNSKWGIKEYNEWIEQERPINVTVTELNISQSNITTLDGIGNLTKLAILKCINNQITSLNGLVNSTNLIKLDCSKNEITSFDGLENLTKLTELFCYNNQLTILPILPNLIKDYYYDGNPVYDYIKNKCGGKLEIYYKVNKEFSNKIGEWFLECKYNPTYKYCRDRVDKEYDELF